MLIAVNAERICVKSLFPPMCTCLMFYKVHGLSIETCTYKIILNTCILPTSHWACSRIPRLLSSLLFFPLELCFYGWIRGEATWHFLFSYPLTALRPRWLTRPCSLPGCEHVWPGSRAAMCTHSDPRPQHEDTCRSACFAWGQGCLSSRCQSDWLWWTESTCCSLKWLTASPQRGLVTLMEQTYSGLLLSIK